MSKDRVIKETFKFASARVSLRYEDENSAKLYGLRSEIRSEGHATLLLSSVMDYADERELSLWLQVQQNGDPRTTLNNSELIHFYERFGFDILDNTRHPVVMVRYPLKGNCEN